MFKLVVLSAVLAVAAARPGLLHSGLVVPAAVSHSSRVDVHAPAVAIHSAPVIAHEVAAPVITHEIATPFVHSAPLVHSSPLVHSAVIAPVATSHSSRVDIHRAATHVVAAPALVASPLVAAVPAIHSVHHGHAALSVHPY